MTRLSHRTTCGKRWARSYFVHECDLAPHHPGECSCAACGVVLAEPICTPVPPTERTLLRARTPSAPEEPLVTLIHRARKPAMPAPRAQPICGACGEPWSHGRRGNPKLQKTCPNVPGAPILGVRA